RLSVLTLCVLVVACGNSIPDFEGISSRSNCADAQRAVRARNARYLEDRSARGVSGKVVEHVFLGTLFGSQAAISVACSEDRLEGIRFSHTSALGRNAFDEWASVLSRAYGAASTERGSNGRIQKVSCEVDGLAILLTEEAGGAASLSIFPRP